MPVPDISKLRKKVDGNPGGDDGWDLGTWVLVFIAGYFALRFLHVL
jgi:hypothetical protein